MSEKHEKHPAQRDPELSKASDREQRELGRRGINAAPQSDEELYMASSPKPKFQSSITATSRLPYEDRRRIHEPPMPEQPPEKPEPWGKDFPMRRGNS